MNKEMQTFKRIAFYKCERCGNVVVKVKDSGIAPFCCGQEMVELEAKTQDELQESHMPVIRRLDYHTLLVCIGTRPHPMTAEHHICFLCLVTSKGFTLRYLAGQTTAEAYFLIPNDVLEVYAYCNIHGLWKLSTSYQCRV